MATCPGATHGIDDPSMAGVLKPAMCERISHGFVESLRARGRGLLFRIRGTAIMKSMANFMNSMNRLVRQTNYWPLSLLVGDVGQPQLLTAVYCSNFQQKSPMENGIGSGYKEYKAERPKAALLVYVVDAFFSA